MKKRFYHAHVLPIFNYGVRIDSGVDHSDIIDIDKNNKAYICNIEK